MASSVRRNSGSSGLKKARGCGSKVMRRRRPPERLRALLRGRDHGLMAAMNAVEIADGDDRAKEGTDRLMGRGSGRSIAHDAEIFRRHRGFDG